MIINVCYVFLNRSKNPVAYFSTLDLFNFDENLMSLESMLKHQELLAKHDKNEHMLERMHSIGIHLYLRTIDELEKYSEMKKELTKYQQLLLKRQYLHLNDDDRLSVIDLYLWVEMALRLAINLISNNRIIASGHVYCAARVVIENVDDELKTAKDYIWLYFLTNEFGLKVCEKLFTQLTCKTLASNEIM